MPPKGQTQRATATQEARRKLQKAKAKKGTTKCSRQGDSKSNPIVVGRGWNAVNKSKFNAVATGWTAVNQNTALKSPVKRSKSTSAPTKQRKAGRPKGYKNKYKLGPLSPTLEYEYSDKLRSAAYIMSRRRLNQGLCDVHDANTGAGAQKLNRKLQNKEKLIAQGRYYMLPY